MVEALAISWVSLSDFLTFNLSSKEVLKYISELGISKVTLRVEDIEAILVGISLQK